ncbi:MAG: CAP domain-containing protein [Phormidesmis sp.]
MKIFNIKRANLSHHQSHTCKWPLGFATAFALLTSTVHIPTFESILPATSGAAQAQMLAQTNWATIEQDLITEHNRVRQNPQSYIPLLEARLASMDSRGNIPNGCGRNCTLLTNEGQSAVREAIQYLQNQSPVGEIAFSSGIAQAARAHAIDQRNGATGHTGSDGSSSMDRVNRFEVPHAGVGENIAYGPSDAQDIMINLIVDDGVASRGHRTNIFRDSWAMAGAGCGSHATYGSVCVINYANAPRGAAAADRQFQIVNNGTVELQSLKVFNADKLNAPLPIGASRTIPLTDGCTVNLTIQLGGNYLPLYWNDVDLCAATLTIDGQNGFKVQY